jgi:hypothetical protein
MVNSPLSVVIHGHFYQPPREDPWLESVEVQPSAAPFHDWNARITEECYRAVVAARVPGPGGRIAKIVNTLEQISFNFGPTLLEWMEMEAPDVYRSILTADARSLARTGGYGNAIAQAYHHTILPLASRREKVSEVRWGIADFRRRFGRDPVGMWLPETAVDGATLDVLAQEGIAFTIVAPHQVEETPPDGLPGLYRSPGGRSVALFIYNGPLSHGVGFGTLLKDAEKWARDMVGNAEGDRSQETEDRGEGRENQGEGSGPRNRLISIATDGETYGHHHRFGEMALAAVLELLAKDPRAKVENFASFLSRNPPRHEVTLVEPSSWSCAHGVERWRADCGCKMDPKDNTQQQWRTGLRDALEWLASRIHRIFETEGSSLLGDPWAAMDRYGTTARVGVDGLRARELLELERVALHLFTSCAWFFDDLAGVEPVQVLRYAARALELAGPNQTELEEGFLARLEEAKSNEGPPRTGREVYLQEAKPKIPAHLRVAAGAALWQEVTGEAPSRHEQDTIDSGVGHPRVPGYRATPGPSGSFFVTHQRTGQEWNVAARIGRPSGASGAIAVREVGEGGPFVRVELPEIPEGFRTPILRALTRKIPDPGQALTDAVEALCGKPNGWDHPSSDRSIPGPTKDQIERVQDLADLHILLGDPIPSEAQTKFFRFLEAADPEVVRHVAVLRAPLGFTPAP